MAKEEEALQSPKNTVPKQPQREVMFSPGFQSVAAMAGWDEEAILCATVVVHDTPDREQIKQKKRIHFHSKTPPMAISRTKRREQRSPVSIPLVPVLNLEEEEEETAEEECEKKKEEAKIDANEGKKKTGGELPAGETYLSCSNSALPCIDRLREELSCAICLEICFEPSTTSCGHSFCQKCLRSAADKCGKRCPKCRQLISNGRSCPVNTVLWNTIQLLFPKEVEARKAAQPPSPGRVCNTGGNTHNRSARVPREVLSRGDVGAIRRRGVPVPSQDEDAALALRLQREEFMDAFREDSTSEQVSGRGNSISLARANLRAMATRAISLRASRGRAV